MPEECPDGKEKLVSTWSGSSHTGRSRPTTCLSSAVATPMLAITPIVQMAARRCRLASRATAVTAVAMPIGSVVVAWPR